MASEAYFSESISVALHEAQLRARTHWDLKGDIPYVIKIRYGEINDNRRTVRVRLRDLEGLRMAWVVIRLKKGPKGWVVDKEHKMSAKRLFHEGDEVTFERDLDGDSSVDNQHNVQVADWGLFRGVKGVVVGVFNITGYLAVKFLGLNEDKAILLPEECFEHLDSDEPSP